MSDIYVVLIINLIIWLGIFGYLFSLNTQINLLKQKLESYQLLNQSEVRHES